MIKKHKWKLLWSSLLILLPVAAGLALWDQLPEQIATHWGLNGQPDGWSSKASAVFALPLVILAVNWVGMLAVSRDPGNQGQNRKIKGLTPWIGPVISIGCGIGTYAGALGTELPVVNLMFGIMGILFVFLGNYLPKCKPNRTIGIRVIWTLRSEENWIATHRFSGRVWMAGGILVLAAAFLPEKWVLPVSMALVLVLVLVSIIYSWAFSRKEQEK